MKNAMIVMDTIAKWERLLQMKYDLVFGETAFDKNLFKDAMKQSFDIFRYVIEKERLPVSINNMTADEYISVLDCCKVIQHMSDYASECFDDDESEDYIFTASQYAVRLFLNNMIWSPSYSGNPVLTDAMEFTDGEQAYPYDVESGDLSDLQKLAQYRAFWD